MNVLLLGQYTSVHKERLAGLLATDWNIDTLVEEEYATRMGDAFARCDALVGFTFNASMPATPSLKLIQTPTTGSEKIELDAVPRGCTVCNVYGHDIGISEYVLLAMLELTIGLNALDRSFRTGSWAGGVSAPGPTHGELSGSTLGIIGYGSIGRLVCAKAKALGMRIVAITGTPPADKGHCEWIESASNLDRLLQESDYVLVACPLTERTRGMIGARELGMMKPHAFLINVARGPIIEEEALFNALESRQIAGAALDVWYNYPTPEEPNAAPSRFPFHTLKNILMTPHASVWSSRLFERRWSEIAQNLDRLARGEALLNVVFKQSS